MKIGALLLAFNAMVLGSGSCVPQHYEDTCYMGPPSNPKKIIYLGPNVGYNKTLSSNSPEKLSSLSPDDSSKNMTGTGYFFGYTYYQYLGSERISKHAIIFNLNYKASNCSDLKTIADIEYINQMVQPGNTNISLLKYEKYFKINTVNLNITYDYNIVNNLCIDAGFDFDYRLSDKYYEKISLENNSVASIKNNSKIIKYEANNKSAVLYDSSIEGIKSYNIGLLFEARYEIMTGSNIDVVPYLGYNLSLTKWLNNWKTDNIYAGVNFRFAL